MRKRLSGKLRGNLYKVYISPDGAKHYSLSKAKDNGFPADEGDGRKGRKKRVGRAAKAKAAKGGA